VNDQRLLATDIKLVETHVDLCDFECAGGPELCCGPDSGGEEALIIHMEIIGEPSLPRLHQGEFKVFLDFGEAVDLDGDEIPDLSLKDAIEEPGVGPLDTSDVRVRASFGQSSSPHGGNRFGTQVRFTANAGLNPRVGRLSRIDQVASTIDFVLPLAEILTAADEAQKAAAGIEEGAESVEFLLWWSSRCDGSILDRAPNTDDHGSPSVVFEASLFLAPFLQLELLGPDRTTGAVDFRGFDQCGGGDGDAVVVGTSSQPQSIILFNPSFMPLVVNDLVFSDPSFSTTAAFPIVVPALEGEISVPVVFQPDIEGPVTAIVTVLGDDPTPPALSLLGEGVPDDPPALSQCVFDSTSVADKTSG
jgi:hypothetical protein